MTINAITMAIASTVFPNPSAWPLGPQTFGWGANASHPGFGGLVDCCLSIDDTDESGSAGRNNKNIRKPAVAKAMAVKGDFLW